MRVITRMNIGGPAYHVSILSAGLDARGYEHLLLTGALGEGEGSRESLADSYGVRRQTVRGLGPQLDIRNDVRALVALVRIIRRWRPDIVHTHTAKAGTLGRIAARIALGRGVVVVHTYHGHVLTEYFGPAKSLLFRTIERGLARLTDQLIGVSQATVDELLDLGIGRPEAFDAIAIGLDLDEFATVGRPTAAARADIGVETSDTIATFVGRLAPIKRIDVLLVAIQHARLAGAQLHLLIVGDGKQRSALERLAVRLGVRDHVTFTGFRDDLVVIARATDIAVLSSDDEGTPVALIEASAAGRPSVATNVGGVAEIVGPDTGVTVPAGDPVAFADALTRLVGDQELRLRMGRNAREAVLERFAAGRLVDDIDRQYRRLLRCAD